MPRSRKVVVLVVVAILALPWVAVAGPRREEVRPAVSHSDLLGRLWDFIMSVWSASGCRIDPDGGEPESQPTIDIDEGCHIDPSGGCRS